MKPSVSVVAFIQARMSSSRLPGKVLMEIEATPMLRMIWERLGRAETIDQIVVVTGRSSADDPIEDLCNRFGVNCFRGDDLDVLKRFAEASESYVADYIVRITGDCPYTDPETVDLVVRTCIEGGFDYAANRMPDERTYPIGLDVEVFKTEVLRRANRLSTQSYQREHVTPYFYDGSDDSIQVFHVRMPGKDLGAERWTVDTEEDLRFIREVAKEVGLDARLSEILRLLSSSPQLRNINSGVLQKRYTETEIKSE